MVVPLVFSLSRERSNWGTMFCSPVLRCLPGGFSEFYIPIREGHGCTSGSEILHSGVFHGLASEGRWGDVIFWTIWNLAARAPPLDVGKGVSSVEPKASLFLRQKVGELNTYQANFEAQGERSFGRIHKPFPGSGLGTRVSPWRPVPREVRCNARETANENGHLPSRGTAWYPPTC